VSQLAQLPNLTRREVAIKELREEIAQIEHELCSSQVTKWRERELSQKLRINQFTIDQLIHENGEASSHQGEVEHDPYQAERSQLKASIAEIERELVTCMQWVAIKRAAQFLGRGIELDDLIQYGMLGVIAGIRHFDPTRGTRLLTAISWWVFQAITRAIMEDSYLIRLPVHVYESVAHIKQEQAKLKTQLGRLPTHQELST
jgi:DNA-directed RNA polymerase sigma subunit (sigma70/sigma32)